MRKSKLGKKGRRLSGLRLTAGVACLVFAGVGADTLLAKGANDAAQDIAVQDYGSMVTFSGGMSKSGGTLYVRIDGPSGENVFEAKTDFGFVDWSVDSKMPSGNYKYDVWFTPMQPVNASEVEPTVESFANEKAVEPGFRTQHKTGVFKVEDGVVSPVLDPDVDVGEHLSMHSHSLSPLERVAGTILNFLVPSANAGTCATPCEVGTGEAQVSLIPTSGSTWEFETQADGSQIRIGPNGGSSEMWRLEAGAPDVSFFMETTGDIGLGTSTPDTKLEIVDTFPNISLVDSDNGNKDYELLNNGGFFFISDRSAGTLPLVINSASPSQSLQITPDGVGFGTASPFAEVTVNGTIGFENGTTPMMFLQETCCDGGDRMIVAHSPGTFDAWGLRYQESGDEFHFQTSDTNRFMTIDLGSGVGIGTEDPATTLHVQRSNGTARLLVEEASGTAAARELFKLSNNGGPFFIFENTDISQSYSFAMGATGHFILSHQQTSGVQMRLTPDGNMTITGSLTEGSSRTIKDGITPIDPATVLAKLDALPVSEWNYQAVPGSRHVGPMAEDFYAVFGFGADNKHIAPRDLAGVALAAAKALKADNDAKDQRIAELEARMARLEAMIVD